MIKERIGREKIITAITIAVNVVLILSAMFHSITFKSEVLENCLVVGIPLLISIFLLFVVKRQKVGEKGKVLLVLSYGLAGIVVFRWAVALLLLL